jgi:hypothetical protein
MANSVPQQVLHRREYIWHCKVLVIFNHYCSIIRTLSQTVILLFSLIFRTEPALNLRSILQHAPNRSFNSISNIFVVTFGRLSYCDSPGWIEAEGRQELENLSGETCIGFGVAELTVTC